MSKERFGLAVAQLGPIHLNDSRESAVARLMAGLPLFSCTAHLLWLRRRAT